jgi:hypothetical protein
MTDLCSKLYHEKDRDAISFTLLSGEGKNKIKA